MPITFVANEFSNPLLQLQAKQQIEIKERIFTGYNQLFDKSMASKLIKWDSFVI